MNENPEREAFEKWAHKQYIFLERENDGRYVDQRADIAWAAWRAGIEYARADQAASLKNRVKKVTKS